MADAPPAVERTEAPGLKELLEYLREARGFDFTGYKRSSLARRVDKRLQALQIESYEQYRDYLEVSPDEFTTLFNTILINVTGFFRDKPAWDFLASDVIPRVLEGRSQERPIRVWSAACSSGEEAYSVAMLLAEALGEDDFRRRVKIYATDVDDEALNKARQAVFPANALEGVEKPLLEKYFEKTPLGFAFRGDVRRSVIFGRNDLVQDAPISHIDLLISRNALIYFTRETQSRILGHFNFALEDDGFLFLGKSEMLLTHADLFVPHNLKWRVFTKVPTHGLRERFAVLGDGTLGAATHSATDLRARAADLVPLAQVVVDRAGFVLEVNNMARTLFNLGAADVGKPFQDLSVSYRPLDLRSGLERAYAEGKALAMKRVQWEADGVERVLEAVVTPLLSRTGAAQGASITFNDITELASLDERHERSKRQLETAYEELQSTVEELETTNEELQSTNEELETTNEELQSTNEELETMNEELESTNEELETMNTEQRGRALEMDRLNLFLEGILGNLGVGVVVVDNDENIQIWNASSQDLWGLRAEEAEGRKLHSLDIGLPVDRIRTLVSDVLAEPESPRELSVDAVNRRGRSFTCDVRVLPLTSPDGRTHGAIVLMSERDSQALGQMSSK